MEIKIRERIGCDHCTAFVDSTYSYSNNQVIIRILVDVRGKGTNEDGVQLMHIESAMSDQSFSPNLSSGLFSWSLYVVFLLCVEYVQWDIYPRLTCCLRAAGSVDLASMTSSQALSPSSSYLVCIHAF